MFNGVIAGEAVIQRLRPFCRAVLEVRVKAGVDAPEGIDIDAAMLNGEVGGLGKTGLEPGVEPVGLILVEPVIGRVGSAVVLESLRQIRLRKAVLVPGKALLNEFHLTGLVDIRRHLAQELAQPVAPGPILRHGPLHVAHQHVVGVIVDGGIGQDGHQVGDRQFADRLDQIVG